MKFLGRTNSRILAMMIIYNYDINKDIDINQQIDYIIENNNLELNENNELDYDKEFLNKLINGVINKIDYLDYIISLVIEGYTIETLSAIDRAILRCATYELIYIKSPKEVVINEFVNVAKAYSEIEGFKASKFDNAVLDKIASSNFKEE